jgi:protein RecA
MAKKKEEPALPSLLGFLSGKIEDAKLDDTIQSLDELGSDLPGTHIPCLTARFLLESTGGKIPYGSNVEIYGWESSGKTTFSWELIAAELANPTSVALFVDAERAGFGYKLASELGVDPKRAKISQPDCGERALDDVKSMLLFMAEYRQKEEILAIEDEEKKPHLIIVVDSVPSLTPKAVIESKIEDEGRRKAAVAALMAEQLPGLNMLIKETKTTVIWINQLRNAFNMKGASWTQTPGGVALKFYADIRISLFLDQVEKLKVDGQDEKVGLRSKVTVVKNKFGVPWRTITMILGWGNGPYDLGIDVMFDLLMACRVIRVKKVYEALDPTQQKAALKAWGITEKDALARRTYHQPQGSTWSSLYVPGLPEVKFQGILGFKKKVLAEPGILDAMLAVINIPDAAKLIGPKLAILRSKAAEINDITEDQLVSEIPVAEGMDAAGATAPSVQLKDFKMEDDAG